MADLRLRLVPYWECEQCGSRHYHPVIDLGNVACGCGVGKGLWFAVPNPESRMPMSRARLGVLVAVILMIALVGCRQAQPPKPEIIPMVMDTEWSMERPRLTAFIVSDGTLEIEATCGGNWVTTTVVPEGKRGVVDVINRFADTTCDSGNQFLVYSRGGSKW